MHESSKSQFVNHDYWVSNGPKLNAGCKFLKILTIKGPAKTDIFTIYWYNFIMKGPIGTLIVFAFWQGCLANIIFTALNIENHPCRPENLKVCRYFFSYHLIHTSFYFSKKVTHTNARVFNTVARKLEKYKLFVGPYTSFYFCC